MQDVPNYGSLMQAFALKQLLLRNGADEVAFIAIKPGRKLLFHSWSYKLKKLLYYVFTMQAIKKYRLDDYYKELHQLFKRFHGLLGGESLQDSAGMDMVIIGSDEVFNCCQYSSWGYTLQLYGEIDCPYVISYAGSFGHTCLKDLQSFGITEEIGNAMKTLKGISVRDRNSYDIVKAITGITPLIHLDPVLIYGFGEEISLQDEIKERNYILIYSYNGRINDKREIDEIKKFARKKHKKLYSLYCRYSWCDDELHPDSPMEIFRYFKHADYVITDTFHGSIFSIITHQIFCTLVRESNVQKISSLLENLGLEDRCVNVFGMIENVLSAAIDYISVEKKLSDSRKEANAYLRHHVLTCKAI